MNRKDIEEALTSRGRRRGAITYDELNDAFPAEYFPIEELERFVKLMETLGVKVIERRKVRRYRPTAKNS